MTLSTLRRLALLLVLTTSLASLTAGATAASVSGPSLPSSRTGLVGSVMSLESPFPAGGPAPLTPAQEGTDAASRTAYQGLGQGAAVSLAEQTFHIGRPSWMPPGNEEGAHIQSYLGSHDALEALPNGEHDVMSSSFPLRANNGSGLAPVSLTLHDDGEAYAPENPLVPIAISKQASGGIAFSAGLSVVPVSASEPEAPAVVGNHVIFTGVAQDTDLVAEPRPGGAELSWQLRSQASPQDEALAFHLPAGDVLQWSPSVPGAVEVVRGGTRVLLVPPADAEGADGRSRPVTYSLSGDVLTTHVDLTGNVDFPVLVDPVFYGYYGAYESSSTWTGWHHEATYSGFGINEAFNLLQIGTNPGAPTGSYGVWYMEAPGPHGDPGSAGITRVDLTNVVHEAAGQSRLVARINGSNGSEPTYTFNGVTGYVYDQPLLEEANLSSADIAFCAQKGGGHDGEEHGTLCDETNNQGEEFEFRDEILGTQSHFNYVQMEGAKVTYRDTTKPNMVVLDHPGYTNQWVKTEPTNWTVEAEDEGLGIEELQVQAPLGHEGFANQLYSCGANGFQGCPNTVTSEPLNLSGLKGSGEFQLSPVAYDAVRNATAGTPAVPLYVDQTGPELELSGALAQAAGHVIGDGNYLLNFNAVDGSPTTLQSGTRSLEVKVDGQLAYTKNTSCGEPKGSPAEGCFALSGNWTMSGQAYGAGPHTITVIAKDWVGNESTQSIPVTVNEAAYEPSGPGAVNLETGDYRLNPTDVSVSGATTVLAVSRTYDSRQLTQGAAGPLGPLWTLSLPGSGAAEEWQSLTPLSQGGGVTAIDTRGEHLTFTPKSGGGYNSPAGYQNETLTAVGSTYQLTDSVGNYTKFTQPSSGASYMPSSAVQASAAGGLNKVTYTFTTKEGITEPTEVLAPEPGEGSCTTTLVQGCRALTFNYATSKTATGEAPSEWGDYKGRLTRVYFTAWEPVKGEMTTTTVAQYTYDTQGRLRAEWDPRLTTPLKTTYGYDSEGHVTAVTPPGGEPWFMHYGTTVGDPNSGRLLSTTRPSAATEAAATQAPKNTAAPTLSTSSPVMGTALTVTNGTWSNTPLTYSYQWERCNAAKGECAAIPGATNQEYTPVAADARDTLAAKVVATNEMGSAAAATTVSQAIAVSLAPQRYGATYGSKGTWSGQFNEPADVALDASGDVWVADSINNRVQELTSTGAFIRAITPEGSNSFSNDRGIAVSPTSGNIYIADTGHNRIVEYTSSGTLVTSFGSLGSGNGQLNAPHGLSVDSSGDVWAADYNNNRIEEFSSSGTYMKVVGSEGSGNGQFHKATGVTVCEAHVYATDFEDERVEEFTTSGEYVRQFGSSGTGTGQFTGISRIACDAGGKVLYVVDKGTDHRVEVFSLTGEYISEFGVNGTVEGQMPGPSGLAVAPNEHVYIADVYDNAIQEWVPPSLTYSKTWGSYGSGNGQLNNPNDVAVNNATGEIWVADKNNNRLEVYSASGGYLKTVASAGSGNGQLAGPNGLAINPTTHNVYVADSGNSRIAEFTESGTWVANFSPTINGKSLNAPHAVAIDPSGDIWIADVENERVAELTSTGSAIRAFGSEGTGNGQFRRDTGITICGGYAYVVDSNDHRVEQFSTTGTYIAQFGSSGYGPGQFSGEPSRITCEPAGRVLYVSDKSSNRVEVFSLTGEFLGAFGSQGTGAGEMDTETGLAVGSAGQLYVSDMSNNRIEEWKPIGAWEEPTQTAPSPGTASVSTIEYHVPIAPGPHAMDAQMVAAWAQTDEPADATAIFPPDKVQGWPASNYERASLFYLDSANRTVNTISPGEAIATTEYNQTNDNVERTLTPDNQQKAMKEGNNSAATAELLGTKSTYSSDGTELTSTLGPQHTIKLAGGGEVSARKHNQYFYDEGSPGGATYHLVTKSIEGALPAGNEAEKETRTVTTGYGGQTGLGWKLHAPTSTTTSTGTQTLTTTTTYEESTGSVSETRTPAGSAGAEYAADAYAAQFGSVGTGAGQLKEARGLATASSGNEYVADTENSRIEEFSASGSYIKTVASSGSGNGQVKNPYAIAVDAKGDLWIADTGNNRVQELNSKGEYLMQLGKEGTAAGQFKAPKGIAIGSKTADVLVVDSGNYRIQKLNEKGEFLSTFGWGVSNGESKLEVCTSGCRAGIAGSGNGQLSETARGDAVTSTGNVWVTDANNNRLVEYNEAGTYVRSVGSSGSGNGQFNHPKGITIGPASTVIVADTENNRIEGFSATGTFQWAAGTHGKGPGQFEESWGITATATGNLYVTDNGNGRVERWVPVSGNPAAHNTQTIYYTAAANSTYPECGKHPEWARLPCQAQHAAQPENEQAVLPALPVTTYKYNMWDKPLTTTDTVGTKTRTTTIVYDGAGRTRESTISSSVGTALPTITDEYNSETGALDKQSTTTESKTTSVSEISNKLGQMTSYTDAGENTATYEYEKEKDDRLIKVSDGKGTQTFGYSTTTGLVTSLKDSAAGTFTAGYDVEGNMTSEGYPNGMTATYTLNQVNEPTALEYVKTTHCTTGCTWYSDTVTPSIHGQWLSQTSSLSKQNYSYNEMGWLTEVQDTPSGKGCTTRLYVLEEDGNRTGQTTREPGSEGKCATEGGTSQTWPYDTADQLTESGVSYDTWGNTTSLPATDAGGTPLTSTFYVNDALATQEQNGEKISYKLDPAGRTLETISSGTINSTVINHYASTGSSPAWTANGSNWTRNITGVNGQLAAIQTNGETPVLQLANLHGDIIATAALSETETKLLSTSDTTEYGVPRTSSPPKYNYLGADQRPTELPTGIINMGARAYIPQLGRFEQRDPQPGGSINAYAYTSDDPVNSADPSGEWTYNYENAEPGQAPEGTPTSWIGPGAIMPQPVNMQLEEEFVAHPPWDAGQVYVSQSVSLQLGTGNAAIAAFDRSFTIPSTSATALGTIMGITGSAPNSLELALAGVPTWAFRFIEHITHHNVSKVGAAIAEAGAESALSPEPWVTISIAGSVRYGIYNIQVQWLGIDFYEP